MRTVRRFLSVLFGVFGVIALAASAAASNAISDMVTARHEAEWLFEMFLDLPALAAFAEQSVAIVFLVGVLAFILAWWAWPRRR